MEGLNSFRLRDSLRRFIVMVKHYAALAMVIGLLAAAGSLYGGSLEGMVKNQGEEPVAGALVNIRNLERSLTTTVASQAHGRYVAADLAPGHYTVRSIGGVRRSAATPVQIDGRRVTLNVILSAPADIKSTTSMSDFASLMPEGEAKTIILARCTECHRPATLPANSLQGLISLRKSREGWKESIEKARGHVASITGFFFSQAMPRQQKDAVLDYLAKNFGPDAPPFDPAKLPGMWAQGAAAKAVITELDLPAGARPYGVAVDSNGNGLVVARFNDHTGQTAEVMKDGDVNDQKRSVVHIGRFDPRTLTYTRLPLPTNWAGAAFFADPKGNLWIGDDDKPQFIEYDIEARKFIFYPYPEDPNARAGMNVIRFHPDGSVWATGLPSSRVLRLNPATKDVTVYAVPSTATSKYTTPFGLAIDGNNMVWFAEETLGKVARINPKTGEIKEHDLPSRPYFVSIPRRMAADAAGNIWVAEYGSASLTRIDFRTGEINQYPTPTKYSGPYAIDVDKKNNLIWVGEMTADQIARFNPRTKTWVEYPVPSRHASVRSIQVDPSRPNRVWYGGYYTDKLAYLDVVE
jgi:virginiamycin B lyase